MALAYVGLAQFLPMVLLLLPAGDFVDRFSRKRILQLSWVVQGLCSSLLLTLSLNGSQNVSGFYAVLALFGAARAFTGPALQSLLPNIVPRAQLASAIALNSSIMKIAVILGPLLGGILYGLGGGSLAYSVCLGCFIAALLLLLPVPVRYIETVSAGEDPLLFAAV